jgi:hypothetical protein
MSGGFVPLEGLAIPLEALCFPKARSLAYALAEEKIDFASLVECKRNGDKDIVIFDADIEIPQVRVNQINARERIAVVFFSSNEAMPEVLALRSDFPRVPHLNLRRKEFPRSLCLYEESYRDLERTWTAQRFVKRIREWLALTAKGKLHQDDQPLEPLLSGSVGNVVLPVDILNEKSLGLSDKLNLSRRGSGPRLFLIAEREELPERHATVFAASIHLFPPQQHGLLQGSPETLADLSSIFERSGMNLVSDLRDRMMKWRMEWDAADNIHKQPLVLILICPKTRESGAEPETSDVLTFITMNTVEEVGKKIGIWDISAGHIVPLVPADTSKKGEDVSVGLLNTSFHLSRDQALYLNEVREASNVSITAIGVGALGSQVVINIARSGFGRWCLIDNDRLMPHNIARHALVPEAVGLPKSTAMAIVANSLIPGEDLFTDIPADVIDPGSHEEQVNSRLGSADIILDMSASVTVARHLALDVVAPAKRASLFLNPSGKDLVLLVEDRSRELRLDGLEMQLYRAIIHEESLKNHLRLSQGRRRYGQSCRNVTTVMPQDMVAMHAAIGGSELKEIVSSEEGQITVWQSDHMRNVKRMDIPFHPLVEGKLGEWLIVSDEGFLSKINNIRNNKLPKETGGVLIGSFDLERRIVYIVDTIPSPPDSEEWPTLYIRGCKGLKKEVEAVNEATMGMLEYVGEWHSHPSGVSTSPSEDDILVFSWIAEWMDRDGLPAVMMIAGDAGRISCYVASIDKSERILKEEMY